MIVFVSLRVLRQIAVNAIGIIAYGIFHAFFMIPLNLSDMMGTNEGVKYVWQEFWQSIDPIRGG